jgi:hypothetical protein
MGVFKKTVKLEFKAAAEDLGKAYLAIGTLVETMGVKGIAVRVSITQPKPEPEPVSEREVGSTRPGSMMFKAVIKQDGTVITEVSDRDPHLCGEVYKVTNAIGKQLSDEEIGPECDTVNEIHEALKKRKSRKPSKAPRRKTTSRK